MVERQEIEIIDSNFEYCIYFSKPNQENMLDDINVKLSPITAVASLVLIYNGIRENNAQVLVFGLSFAALAGTGFKDFADRIRNRKNEETVYESSRADLEVFTLV